MKHLYPISGTLVILAALTLGIPAEAGITPLRMTALPVNTLLTLSAYQDSGHEEESPAESEDDHATPGSEDGHADTGADDGHGEADLGQERAAALAVTAPPAWYGKVVWGAGLLFVLAATLGSAAIVLKGPEPADPADDHAHH